MTVNEFILSIMPFLDTAISFSFLVLGIGFAFKCTSFASKLIIAGLAEGSIKGKKSYQDEMAIYDEQPINEIQRLPDRISLAQLIDGELPE